MLLLAAAALCVPVNQGFFLNAARLGPTSHVGLFYATCPLVVLLLAWAMRLERPDLGRLWGVLASVLGVVIIGVGSAWQGGGTAADTRAVMMADLLLIGAVLSWGGYLTLSKPLIMRHGSLPVLTATFLVGALLDLPIALIASPQIPSPGSGLFAGLDRAGVPDPRHHSGEPRLPESRPSPARREPGGQLQQCVAPS